MAHRMGRLTKQNHAKYRRRAYAAGMLAPRERAEPTVWLPLSGTPLLHVEEGPGRPPIVPVGASRGGTPRGADDKRAA